MKDVWSNMQVVVGVIVFMCVCVCTGRLSMT